MIPKLLKKALKKVDPRVIPPEEEARKFKEGCSRRYINVGIATRNFYNGVAEQMKDEELREYAREIEKAIYSKDSQLYETYTFLFRNRMGELGVWKSVKGLSTYQKVKIMRNVSKLLKSRGYGDGKGK